MKITVAYIWILLWIIVFLIGFRAENQELLWNQGFHILHMQYYRLVSALLLHTNVFHLLANAVAVYWVGDFLYGQVGTIAMFLFSVIAGAVSNAVFSWVYPNSCSFGGSPAVFALMGLIVVLQFMRKDVPIFQWQNTYGVWILSYGILSNIPLFSKNISTLVLHTVAFAVGMLFAAMGIKMGIL